MPCSHAATIRRHDPDRYFCSLFAPAGARDTLFTLYAFNHELARAREVASEPTLALIRLQWWREIVEGGARAHDVATSLRVALDQGRLHAEDLLAMIEARMLEAEPSIPSVADWRAWLLQGPGSLAVAAGRVLGAPPSALLRLRRLGAGYGAAGILRSAESLARQGRCLLPADILAAYGVTLHEAMSDPTSAKLSGVHTALALVGRALLGAKLPCAKAWIPAALPAVLARRDLSRPTQGTRTRPLNDRFAVTWSALRLRA